MLALDDNTYSPTEEANDLPPPLINDMDNVDILANIPNLQLPHFQVEEVLLEDLLGFVSPTNAQPENAVNNVQVGMVHTFFNEMDPSALGRPSPAANSPHPATIRLWAKFFSSVDPSLPAVSILREWMNFFTMMLLKLSSSD